MNPDVVIIGAGVAGLSAAAGLTKNGLSCLLVERTPFPGGRAAELSCKATESCARCNACLLEESLRDVGRTQGCRVATQAVVSACRPHQDGFRLTLAKDPVYLDPDTCIRCGLCHDVCPAKDRAIRRSPSSSSLGQGFALCGESCLHLQGLDCQACVDVCPVRAIDFSAEPTSEEVEARAVLATPGFTPFDPAGKPRLGHGRLADVVTALELDRSLRVDGRLRRPSDGTPPTRLAFVQCVGSRDKSIGRDYCSRVCCGYALRMARLIRHRWPNTQISFFYMDIQTVGRDFHRYYRAVRDEIELIHGIPGEITAGPDGALNVPFLNEALGRPETREYDLVVLSVGLGPPDPSLPEALGLETDEDGFMRSNPRHGVFVAGAAEGPMSVAEARARAAGAAAEITAYLHGKK